MCRTIRPLQDLAPPATSDEGHDAALQHVRSTAGTAAKPSRTNAEAFDRAVAEGEAVTGRLLQELVTSAPPRDRAVEAEQRSLARSG